jgi:hypothetical protein
MASPFSKIGEFLKSPQGRRLTEQAKTYARDPRNRAKAKQMMDRFRGGKGGGAGRH